MSVVGLIAVNIVRGSLFDCEALGSCLGSRQIGVCGTEDVETALPKLVDLCSLPFCKVIMWGNT